MWLFNCITTGAQNVAAGIGNFARRWRGGSRRHYRQRRRAANHRAFRQSLFRLNAPLDFIVPWRHVLALECLESRVLLSITATPDSYSASNTTALVVAAPGVLINDTDSGGYQLTAHLQSQPSHGTTSLNGDGSFTYTANAGYRGSDTFAYYDTDTQSNQSYPTSVTINVNYGVISAVDSTKMAADTIHLGNQILGGSDGAPGTAQNLSLVYDSVAGQPDQVVEGDFELSNPPPSDTLTATLTFNGVQQLPVYYSTNGLSGTPTIHVAEQVSTVGLATGRYPYSLALSGTTMAGTSTINGFANVVNNSASPVGLGWGHSWRVPRLPEQCARRARRRAAYSGRFHRLVFHGERR